jgi:hypothetical protein
MRGIRAIPMASPRPTQLIANGATASNFLGAATRLLSSCSLSYRRTDGRDKIALVLFGSISGKTFVDLFSHPCSLLSYAVGFVGTV